jgi:hypothetical protein
VSAPVTVEFDGKFTVTYNCGEKGTSAFRCFPRAGKLFAAAPDLLEACQLMLLRHEEIRCQDECEACRVAYAAIAKAKEVSPMVKEGAA